MINWGALVDVLDAATLGRLLEIGAEMRPYLLRAAGGVPLGGEAKARLDELLTDYEQLLQSALGQLEGKLPEH